MKRAAALVVIIGLATIFAMGQTPDRETRNLKDFTRISFGISGNLNIRLGNEFSVTLEGDKNDLNRVITEVSGGRLVIKHENFRFSNYGRITVNITMPEITGLGVSGSGNAEILDHVSAKDLDLNVSGSGKLITSDLEVENIDCSISGSGNITLAGGNAENVDLSVSGSGNFIGDRAQIKMLDVSISGSGNCTCFVTGSIDASISGSGYVTYKGEPSIDARVSGSGRVRSAR